MNFDSIKKIISDNKKLLISLGIVPVAFFATKAVKKIIDMKRRAPQITTEPQWELASLEKIIAIKEVRSHLDVDDNALSIVFGRNKKHGTWGYYIRNKGKNWLYLCCSDEYENVYKQTPYWIELDDELSSEFAQSGLKEQYNWFPHPSIKGRLIIEVSQEDMKNPENVAEIILELTRTMLSNNPGENIKQGIHDASTL